jgi:hypothetical protein
VRAFLEFAALDLISKGRPELIAGRGSFVDAYPLSAFELKDYDPLWSKKLELLLKIRANSMVH